MDLIESKVILSQEVGSIDRYDREYTFFESEYPLLENTQVIGVYVLNFRSDRTSKRRWLDEPSGLHEIFDGRPCYDITVIFDVDESEVIDISC